MSQVQSAVVLITGAGGGFGQELTRQLLAKGSRLILTDHPVANLPATVETLDKNQPGEILASLELDLVSPDGCNALYTATQELGIAPDILINNAGISAVGLMTEIPTERWEAVIQLNLITPMRLSALFAADMMTRESGHIVNISSMSGWVATPGLTPYATSKYGLRGFGEGLRLELAPYNVRVTNVYPSYSRKPILDSPRFGSFAARRAKVASALMTEPKDVMATTIRAIERNTDELFPDKAALVGQWLKRYCPIVLDWL